MTEDRADALMARIAEQLDIPSDVMEAGNAAAKAYRQYAEAERASFMSYYNAMYALMFGWRGFAVERFANAVKPPLDPYHPPAEQEQG